MIYSYATFRLNWAKTKAISSLLKVEIKVGTYVGSRINTLKNRKKYGKIRCFILYFTVFYRIFYIVFFATQRICQPWLKVILLRKLTYTYAHLRLLKWAFRRENDAKTTPKRFSVHYKRLF